ncbi:hypothetical protein LPJ66_010047, partial [Kickxella alabastrina]
PCVGGEPDAGAGGDSAFLSRFAVLSVARPAGPAEPLAPVLFAYSVLHDAVARAHTLRFGGRTGAFADMVAEGMQAVAALVRDDVAFACAVERTQAAEVADALLRLLPKGAATSYLAARALLRMRDMPAAADLFASAVAADALVAPGLRDAIGLDEAEPVDNAAAYHEHVAELFAAAGWLPGVVRFGHLALQAAAGDEARRARLWFRVFHAEVERGGFEPAYMAVMAQPDASLQRDSLRHLVSVLCERAGGIAVLCRLTFPGLQEEVERSLLFKARHSDPAVPRPNYYRILYAFHIYRGNYRNAASAMYQYAARLAMLLRSGSSGSVDVARLLVDQGQALLACINGLTLVDTQSAWVITGASSDVDSDSAPSPKRKRIAIGRFDPERAQNIDIVELADVRREYAMCMARITLGVVFAELLDRSVLLEPQDIVDLHVKTANYDAAFTFARSFELSVACVFEDIVRRCVQISALSEDEGEEVVPQALWRNSGMPSAGGGTPGEQCWRMLQYYLDKEEAQSAECRYRLMVAECVLKSELCDYALAPWITTPLLRSCPQDLIRLCLRHGCVTEAGDFLLQHMATVLKRISAPPSTTTVAAGCNVTGGGVLTREVWLPYGLIDRTIGILDDSVERFKAAVTRIRLAQDETEEVTTEENCSGLLKSYEERLEGLVRLSAEIRAAVDRYVTVAARENPSVTTMVAVA